MNETNVKTFADITLSNRRIIQRGKIGSVKSLSSFPLSSYASSKMESVSKPYFIALSAICLIGAVYALLSASNLSLKMFHSADLILKIENIAVFGLLIILAIPQKSRLNRRVVKLFQLKFQANRDLLKSLWMQSMSKCTSFLNQ